MGGHLSVWEASEQKQNKQTNNLEPKGGGGGGSVCLNCPPPPPPTHPCILTRMKNLLSTQNFKIVMWLPYLVVALHQLSNDPKFRAVILKHSYDIGGIYSIKLHEQQSFTVWSLFLDCNILYLYLRVGRAILHCGTALVVQWPHHRAIILHGNHSYDIEGILRNRTLYG